MFFIGKMKACVLIIGGKTGSFFPDSDRRKFLTFNTAILFCQ